MLDREWGYTVMSTGSVQADNGAGLTQGIIGLVNKGQPRGLEDWGVLRAWALGASSKPIWPWTRCTSPWQATPDGAKPLRHHGL